MIVAATRKRSATNSIGVEPTTTGSSCSCQFSAATGPLASWPRLSSNASPERESVSPSTPVSVAVPSEPTTATNSRVSATGSAADSAAIESEPPATVKPTPPAAIEPLVTVIEIVLSFAPAMSPASTASPSSLKSTSTGRVS